MSSRFITAMNMKLSALAQPLKVKVNIKVNINVDNVKDKVKVTSCL
jgi:hypothetical protein